MKEQRNEIGDNEIRIIGAETPTPVSKEPRRHTRRRIVAACIFIGVAIIIFLLKWLKYAPTLENFPDPIELPSPPEAAATPIAVAPKGRVEIVDTVVSGVPLRFFFPEGATPSLEIGRQIETDSTIILALQAADLRGDNYEINCAFVLRGELISRGEAKAGFCSIVDGEITIGVADATPKLEEALTSKGDFFRQYPLVVGGQVVENKPKGRSLRRALADVGGRICVITSGTRLTFREFSETLCEAGVRNAIYLVGSGAYGFFTSPSGEKEKLGSEPSEQVSDNINFIVWR